MAEQPGLQSIRIDIALAVKDLLYVEFLAAHAVAT
jgi:hypothetical protein